MVDGALYPLPRRLAFLVIVGRHPAQPETVWHGTHHVALRRIPRPSRRRLGPLYHCVDGARRHAKRPRRRSVAAVFVHGVDDLGLARRGPLFDSLVDYWHRRSHTSL